MNKKDINLILPAVTIVLAIGAYFLCSNYLMPTIGENLAKVSAYNQDISAAEEKISSISTTEKIISQMSDTVNNLLIAIPDSVDAPNVIAEVETVANKNQVALSSMTPPAVSAGNASNSGMAVNVSVSGTYTNVKSFINSLETSIRFSKISNISISSSNEGISAAINFNVYSRPAS